MDGGGRKWKCNRSGYLIDQATYFIFQTIAGQWEEFWFTCVSHGMLRANLNKMLGSINRNWV